MRKIFHKHSQRFLRSRAFSCSSAFFCSIALVACGGGGSTDSTSSTSNPTNGTTTPVASSLASGYQQAKWGSNMTVSFPSSCTMTIVSTGMPNHALPSYYLAPVNGNGTVVATTPSGTQLGVIRNPDSSTPVSMTYNTCPVKAAATTATSGGTIGIMISGAALFNAAEATPTIAALSDNVSYTFTDSNNVSQIASFIDSCNGHYAGNATGSTYHYHGVSACVTAEVDKSGGASHLIGVALDGFPIYGGRDINGNVISVSQLDACNGITSPTPEFPDGVYHYVLPEGVTNLQSSLRCYAGTVTQTQVAKAQANGICVTPSLALNTSANNLAATIRRRQAVLSSTSYTEVKI